MHRTNTTTNARQANPMRQTAARLEQARRRVQIALRAADEGEPTFDTLEAISRALVDAQGDLEAVAVGFDRAPGRTLAARGR